MQENFQLSNAHLKQFWVAALLCTSILSAGSVRRRDTPLALVLSLASHHHLAVPTRFRIMAPSLSNSLADCTHLATGKLDHGAIPQLGI
ncbi:hypothetical protein B0T14DRAFT_1805 [Immersiella caudata]|uniref:Uncharacterized protein n=1 Tax=Immersiella caudata TaxID=314043 RepID=A0AA39XCD6_9PEZI|nr:hypothetical protein B0T14DRAFT_1805 [Immersiella caudata]